MLMSCHQNAKENHEIKTANRPFENVALRYNSSKPMFEEIKSRFYSGKVCYHSIQNSLSSHLSIQNSLSPHLLSRKTQNIENYRYDCGSS
jgi:hypothetical protein